MCASNLTKKIKRSAGPNRAGTKKGPEQGDSLPGAIRYGRMIPSYSALLRTLGFGSSPRDFPHSNGLPRHRNLVDSFRTLAEALLGGRLSIRSFHLVAPESSPPNQCGLSAILPFHRKGPVRVSLGQNAALVDIQQNVNLVPVPIDNSDHDGLVNFQVWMHHRIAPIRRFVSATSGGH